MKKNVVSRRMPKKQLYQLVLQRMEVLTGKVFSNQYAECELMTLGEMLQNSRLTQKMRINISLAADGMSTKLKSTGDTRKTHGFLVALSSEILK
jgi:hypothetical protein